MSYFIPEPLNISTLVYMLHTNLKIDPEKLEGIFENVEPISYENPIQGIIKISVRGKTKGLCKKLVFRRSHTASCQEKNFRNQVSFYVRIIDTMPVFMKSDCVNTSEGFYSSEIYDMYKENSSKKVLQYKKGQTAFQFKKLKIEFEKNDFIPGNIIRIFTSVTRKSQDKQLKCINYELTENDIQNKSINFEFKNGCYAHCLYVDPLCSNEKEVHCKLFVDFVVEVNMFMFTSGKIKIAGCTREYQIDDAMNVLMMHLEKQLPSDSMRDLFGKSAKEFKITQKEPVMINSDFASNYEIKRYELDSMIRNKYNVLSSFEPCTHPAVIIKYYHNQSYENQIGKCICVQKYNNPYLCGGRGKGNGPGECKTVTILVFQSGKVILTGARSIQQVRDGYAFINTILSENRIALERSV